MTTAVQAVVSGRVQGVGFRASCQQQAVRLGVTGWVRNRPEGTVELWAEGAERAVQQLLDWCRTGPRWGEVDGVAVQLVAATGHTDFRVR